MKPTTLLFSMLSIVFCLPLFADWELVGSSKSGYDYYIDFERIKQSNGYVYFWRLNSFEKNTKHGIGSFMGFYEGDCRNIKIKSLSGVAYSEKMGQGEIIGTKNLENYIRDWESIIPNSTGEDVLLKACEYIKKQ